MDDNRIGWLLIGSLCLLFGLSESGKLLVDDVRGNVFDLSTLDWDNTTEIAKTTIRMGCSIDINEDGLSNPQPLILHPGTERFLHPRSADGVLHLDPNEDVELFCSASFAGSFSGNQHLFATCIGHNQFLIGGQLVPIANLSCTAHARHVDRLAARNQCGPGITHVEIGFRVSSTRFLKTQDVCHDESRMSTLYTYYRQTPANMGFQRAFPRPGFIKGSFYGDLPVDNLYTGATQRETISRILGNERVNQLFDDSRNFFLARGHLAAKTDFITGPEQRASFFFVNAAPQWQSFNAGNWERIESGVKSFVAKRNLFTTIYTGTFGVLRMSDQVGIERELFLHVDAGGSRESGLIPVPMYFYKVVIDDANRGIVFVGLNNPHVTRDEVASGRFDLCRDVGDRVNYVNWDRSNLARGYSYACEVNEFVQNVTDLPRTLFATALLV